MHRIMIIEDEEPLLELYKHEFEDEGYQVMPINNGREVIDSIKSFKPEVIVLDIRLKGIEGLEILEQIKNYDLNLPVILNTAYSTYKANFSSWIADDYVIKSPDLTELKTTIKKHILSN
ncbi:MAG: response regulator [candidate division Zixibacteria bacterium]|nr:response regulator [candidate division Zixibacteria bacterium]